MKKGGKKKLYILLAAAVIIVVLIVVGQQTKNKGVGIIVGTPANKSIEEVIPASGKIQPVVEVKISPDVSGEIIELNCKEGDQVKKGDLLIKIKQDVYISAVDRAEASLNSIKAQYSEQKVQRTKIQLSFNRNKSLYEQKAISQQEYEAALAESEVSKEQLKAAEYNIKSAEAALKEAKENLIKTTIYAPMSGTISKLNVELGERVVGTSQMAGTEMLRIANLDDMEVLVNVNENDIIKIKQSDTSQIEVDAYPNRKFTGLVTQIANSSKNSGTSSTTSIDQVTNFEVKIRILPDSYKDLLINNLIPFRPGMSASVSIRTEKHNNALTVPLQSITTRSGLLDSLKYGKGIKEQVFVYNSKTQTVTPVIIKTGIQDMESIEITEGLSANSQIVTGPYNAISKDLTGNSKVYVINNQENKSKEKKTDDKKGK
jgi:HlyD family secretion protein